MQSFEFSNILTICTFMGSVFLSIVLYLFSKKTQHQTNEILKEVKNTSRNIDQFLLQVSIEPSIIKFIKKISVKNNTIEDFIILLVIIKNNCDTKKTLCGFSSEFKFSDAWEQSLTHLIDLVPQFFVLDSNEDSFKLHEIFNNVLNKIFNRNKSISEIVERIIELYINKEKDSNYNNKMTDLIDNLSKKIGEVYG